MPTESPPNHDRDTPPELLDRALLVQRWQHGSEAFFLRHERRGNLTALTDGRKVRYAWPDIFAFEGGQPPAGQAEAYQADLLTEDQAARLCSVKPGYVIAAAKKGDLPARRVGRAYRFVPAEVEAWHKRRFVNRKRRKNSRKIEDE